MSRWIFTLISFFHLPILEAARRCLAAASPESLPTPIPLVGLREITNWGWLFLKTVSSLAFFYHIARMCCLPACSDEYFDTLLGPSFDDLIDRGSPGKTKRCR
jgi:hypothetical protein